MLRKRVIFTLLYSSGKYCLSRNFNLQIVGDYEWLLNNYNFSNISQYIDELIILDVSRDKRNMSDFCEQIALLSKSCFIPIAAGGGISSTEYADKIYKAGGEKIVINSLLFTNPKKIKELANKFGRQAIVGSIDIKMIANDVKFYIKNGTYEVDQPTGKIINHLSKLPLGELYINSIDNDGVGNGLDMKLIDLFKNKIKIPIILAGGVGRPNHFLDGFNNPFVSAVSTAHLFNFVGNGLEITRGMLYEQGSNIAHWSSYKEFFNEIKSRKK